MRDVIVVGAGGGGAVIAKELACRGLNVLLLEADRALPIRNMTGLTSRAMRTIQPVDIFGLGRLIDRDRHGCGSWRKALCLFSCRG